jgi:hypothetical protein
MFFIVHGHKNRHGTQPVNRETVRFSERFATQRAADARRFQECRDLLGLNLAIRDEHAPRLVIHQRPRDSCNCREELI